MACIVVPSVFLVLPVNVWTTATIVSAPLVLLRQVPFSFFIAVHLLIPVYVPMRLLFPITVLSLPDPLSMMSVSVALLMLPITMSAVFVPAASFAVITVSSF